MRGVTIDTGTSNTRVCLWQGTQVIGRAAVAVGVRDAVLGGVACLQDAVRAALDAALQAGGCPREALDLVLACGMIGSRLGLVAVPNIPAPAGAEDLARALQTVTLPAVFARPIWFVPGVRNSVSQSCRSALEALDTMRGEESETVGLLARLRVHGPCLIILPGSGTKFVQVDERQRIVGSLTTLGGELLDVLTHQSSLATALEKQFVERLNVELLLEGAAVAQRQGLSRAIFMVQTLMVFSALNRDARASFLLGAMVGADLQALKNSAAIQLQAEGPVIVSGKAALRMAFAQVLAQDDVFAHRLRVVSEDEQADVAGYGALHLARLRGLLN